MSFICFRRAQLSDLEALILLAKHVEPGLTLPSTRDLLEKRLNDSERAFNESIKSPTNEYYLFVLEDLEDKRLIGTAAIQSNIGQNLPFYSFKLSEHTARSPELEVEINHERLFLVADHKDKSELCTLFIDPNYRNHDNGNCLSRSRFLFIKSFMERFQSNIVAELRGLSLKNGHSPFYDHVIFPFTHIPYRKMLALALAGEKLFLDQLIPITPLYASLFPVEVRKIIGQPHPNSCAAQHMLYKQGFYYNHYVHVFDAGPMVEAQTYNIHTIKNASIHPLISIKKPNMTDRFLLSNTSLDFKATVANIDIYPDGCILSDSIANRLNLKIGDSVLISPFI